MTLPPVVPPPDSAPMVCEKPARSSVAPATLASDTVVPVGKALLFEVRTMPAFTVVVPA